MTEILIQRLGTDMNVIFNPHDITLKELPVIYGFNNGGSMQGLLGLLISEDGLVLGEHLCTNEAYMLSDLGILKGTRLDRHDSFRKHYPNGYRMEFVSIDNIDGHEKLQAAFAKNKTNKK